MNSLNSEWMLRSLAIGAVASACVWLCPVSWRGRIRRAVPVAAFLALVLLTVSLGGWLPEIKVVPATLPKLAATAIPLPSWMPTLWTVGAGLCLLRLGLGFYAIWNLLRHTRPVPGQEWRELLAECQATLGLRGHLRLRLAGSKFVPSATGLLRRTVLLPDEALEWTTEQRRLVLLHELGHFRRGDLWTHALGRVTCALHWFNPFVWLLQRQLAVEREFACDELVLARGAEPKDYATVLWQMATNTRHRPTAAAAFLAMASPRMGKLELRVRRILAPARKAGRFLRLTDAALCAVLAAILFGAACAAYKPAMTPQGLSEQDTPWTADEIQARAAADPWPGN
jgi:beta-lactamase regulating signal transducer with metallopeptidase domain